MGEVKCYHVTIEEVSGTMFAVDARSEEEARRRYLSGHHVEVQYWMVDTHIVDIEVTDDMPTLGVEDMGDQHSE